jgi:CLIP-associating protein 1/2
MLTARQAVHHLLLCIQCVLQDPQKTLALFPDLSETQKNLAVYLMGQNGLLAGGMGTPEKVMREMVGLMARGT